MKVYHDMVLATSGSILCDRSVHLWDGFAALKGLKNCPDMDENWGLGGLMPLDMDALSLV